MENSYDLLEVLNYIEPAQLSYNQWVAVGMALETEGYSVEVWERWSRRDPGRYHTGECGKKWRSFKGSSHKPVTGGTIIQYAREQGWTPPVNLGRPIDWDDDIISDGVVVDKNWVEGKEVAEPACWDPAGELIRYLEALFEAGDNVGYVVKSWQKEDKWLPADKGSWDRTAGQLIEALTKCGGGFGQCPGGLQPRGRRLDPF